MIVSRHHSRSPHLREPVREIHSLRTGRFHGAPGRAMNLPCPVTPHHETVTRLFREKPATGQPPSRNSRLHESHFTNPPPRKTARPNHQQTRPVHQQPNQTISNPTNHQQPDQTISKPDQSISTTQRQKNCPPAKEPSAARPNVSPKTANQKPKNCPPAREPSAGQRTTSRPSRLISGLCRR